MRVPTLVLHGRDDTLITLSGAERTAELIPGADLLVLADMGHDLPEPLWPKIVHAIPATSPRRPAWAPRSDGRHAMAGPLNGVRIIELAGIGPGPFAAMLLADMGAEVIRVERAQSVRGPAPDTPSSDVLLRGRRNVAIDLKHPDGAATLLDLVADADALIEGFRPGVTERLGIGPDVCLARNPRPVYGRMPNTIHSKTCLRNLTSRTPAVSAPHLPARFRHQRQFSFLIVLADQIADDIGGEATLWANGNLFQRHIPACLLDPPFQIVDGFQLRHLGADQA